MTVPRRTDEFQKMPGKAQVSLGSREKLSGLQCHQMRVQPSLRSSADASLQSSPSRGVTGTHSEPGQSQMLSVPQKPEKSCSEPLWLL